MSRTLLVDDPVVLGAIGKLPLEVAQGPPQRSFLRHLLCTWRILADWRMPAAVCRAGFMHSVYSTSYYPQALFGLDERTTVQAILGDDAEDLVFRFCTMNRRGFWEELAARRRFRTLTYPDRFRSGAPVRVSRQTLKWLLMIESANMAEQSKAEDFGPAPWMSRMLHWWQFLDERSIPLRLGRRPTLTRHADESAIEAYRCALNAPVRRAILLLDEAIWHNPWAAEPKVMRALCALETKEKGVSLCVQQSARLLAAWATPWDKRLTRNGWSALVDRIEPARHTRHRAQPSFEDVCAVLSKRSRTPRWLVV